MSQAPWCTAVAAATGEPLAGSASRLRHWMMVEQPGPWGHEALLESDFPSQVGRELLAWEERLGVRTLLIHRRDRPAPSPRRCFAAFTGRRERRLATFEIRDPHELLDLDIEALVQDRWRGFGDSLAHPLFLVCTHGKHDRCCARYGGPVGRALAQRADVWECSHVGGDRFAGNVVCFPHGVYFGHVTAESAARLVKSYEEGFVTLEHFRGHSSHAPAVQAAEYELRVAMGLLRLDDVVLEQHTSAADRRHRVVFRIPDGHTRTVDLREFTLDRRPLTCKAERAQSPRSFVLEGIS